MSAAHANALEALAAHSKIVADTGDFEMIKKFQPLDATTNPSLLLKAATMPVYAPLVDEAIAFARAKGGSIEEQVVTAANKMAVNFGVEISKVVPGVVSTEVDARLSFDVEASLKRARELIALYAAAGVGKDRVLIKLATTWEGVRAAEVLEREGIHVNMTLLFSLAQAKAAAEAGATLISPFVGRITDWHTKAQGVDGFEPESDPGVASVRRIYSYYKRHGHATIVMAASFRTPQQVLALTGCDKLTISPDILSKLRDLPADGVTRHLSAPAEEEKEAAPAPITHSAFLFEMNEDPMAVEKLSEGIRLFAADNRKLDALIRARLEA